MSTHAGLDKLLNPKKKAVKIKIQSNAQLEFLIPKGRIKEFVKQAVSELKTLLIVPLDIKYWYPRRGEEGFGKARVTIFLYLKDRHPQTLEKLDYE